MNRRDALKTTALALGALSATRAMALPAPVGLKIGITDWNLQKEGDVAAIELAGSVSV